MTKIQRFGIALWVVVFFILLAKPLHLGDLPFYILLGLTWIGAMLFIHQEPKP